MKFMGALLAASIVAGIIVAAVCLPALFGAAVLYFGFNLVGPSLFNVEALTFIQAFGICLVASAIGNFFRSYIKGGK